MIVKKLAVCGTLESSDCMIDIRPSGSGKTEIEIESVVYSQYGKAIHKVVSDFVAENNVENAEIVVKDRGAYDCVIRARLETALKRAGGEEE